MITPLLTLGGVAVLCSAGYGLITAFNWMDEVEIKPKNPKIKLGKDRKEGGVDNDRFEHLRKRVKSES